MLYFFVLCGILLSTGCARTPHDYSAFERSRPKSILVIPPLNNSIEVNAPYIYLATITRPLAEKGYYVFPVAVIDHFLKENGLPTPHEMNGIPLDKIGEHIGADAVLYVTIENWGQKFQVIQSVTVVSVTLRLVDVQTGEEIWQATARAEAGSGNSGNDPLAALVAAVITQVLNTTVADPTPGLARQANYRAIYSQYSGLPDGPYKAPAQKSME